MAREPLRLETARLQWMTRTSIGATSCPRHSTTLAATAFTTVGSQVISSAHSAGSQSSHAVGLTRPKPNSLRVSDPSATFTWFSRPAKAVVRGVAAVACDSYEEPQVKVECQVRTSGRRAVLKRTWRAPLPKVLPLPDTPDP